MFIAHKARECLKFIPRLFELPKELQKRIQEKRDFEDEERDKEILEAQRRAFLDQSPRPVMEIIKDRAMSKAILVRENLCFYNIFCLNGQKSPITKKNRFRCL